VPTEPPLNRRAALAIGSALLLVVHVGMALRMRWFSVLADEAGYLGNGRWLASAGPVWPMGKSSFYSFGYGVALIPVNLVTTSPRGVYTGALITNSILMVSLFPLLAVAARRFFDATDRAAIAGAAAASLYPAVLLQSNVAWSESLVMPLTVTLFLAVHSLVDDHVHWYDIAAVGTVTGLLTWAHPRFIPVAAVVVLFLAVSAWHRWISSTQAVVNAVVLAVLGALGLIVSSRIRNDRWDEVDSPPSSGNYFKAVLHPRALLGQLSGEMWYLVTGSLGLAAIGVAAFVFRIRSDAGPRRLTAAFVLAVAAVIAALSVLSSYATATRPDQLVYGRYNEATIPMLICAGAVFLLQVKRRQRSSALLIAAAASAALAAATLVLRGSSRFDTGWNSLNVLAIGPWIHHVERHVIVAATLAAVAVMIVATVISARAAVVALAVMSCCLVVGAAVTFQSRLVDAQKQYEHWSIPDQMKAFDSIKLAAYDESPGSLTQVGMWGYPMFLPHTRIVPYNASRGERPAPGTQLVIAGMGAAPPAGAESARLALVDDRMQQKFWLLPAGATP